MKAVKKGAVLVDRYRIERELGSGGYGRTYLAQDTTLDRQVVIKELLEQWTRQAPIVKRFINEAMAMSRLNHPNVVTVYDLLGPEQYRHLKQYYIVMEFMSGGSVDTRLRAEEGLTWEQTVKIAIRVCKALSAAHDRGIVHRDIKPANILISADLDVVKLADFGVAHLPDQQLTMAGSVPGTLIYMSPEAFLASYQLTGQADLYALGVTLYLLLTGRQYLDYAECWRRAEEDVRRAHRLSPEVELPFPQQSECHTLTQKYWIQTVREVPPPDPRTHNPQLPPELTRIVLRTLAKDPAQRYATPQAMISELEPLTVLPRPVTVSPPTRLTQAPDDWLVNDMIDRSLEAAQQNQLTTALERIQAAANLAPRNTRVLAALANIQMKRSDFRAAIQVWRQVLEIDPAYTELYSKLGHCYNALGEADKAIEIQLEGLHRPENKERNASLYQGLANSYSLAEKLDEAIWALKKSIQIRYDDRKMALLKKFEAEAARRG